MRALVLGGGPSGLAAAINLKRKGLEVTIIEKNKNLGKKLLLTGSGRCNYFNEDFNINKYFTSDYDSLNKIINDTNKDKALNFFDSIGLVGTIKNGYYYPFSEKSETMLDCLIETIKALDIEILLETEVKKIEKNDKFIVDTNKGKIESDIVVLSMGSKCYPKTGSNGDSYKFLKDFGHSIEKVRPALVPLKTNSKLLKYTSGVRTMVKVTYDKYIETGQLQINKDSISGICILNLSGIIIKDLDNNKKPSIRLNFLDSLNIDKETCYKYLLNIYNKTNKKSISNILNGILNYKLVNFFLDSLKIDKDKDFKDLTNEEKNNLSEILTDFKIDITGYDDFDKAQVCSGGVPLNEIDPNTMESKKNKDLYITGEVLEPFGICGGYNLGFSFITGLLVGDNID